MAQYFVHLFRTKSFLPLACTNMSETDKLKVDGAKRTLLMLKPTRAAKCLAVLTHWLEQPWNVYFPSKMTRSGQAIKTCSNVTCACLLQIFGCFTKRAYLFVHLERIALLFVSFFDILRRKMEENLCSRSCKVVDIVKIQVYDHIWELSFKILLCIEWNRLLWHLINSPDPLCEAIIFVTVLFT